MSLTPDLIFKKFQNSLGRVYYTTDEVPNAYFKIGRRATVRYDDKLRKLVLAYKTPFKVFSSYYAFKHPSVIPPKEVDKVKFSSLVDMERLKDYLRQPDVLFTKEFSDNITFVEIGLFYQFNANSVGVKGIALVGGKFIGFSKIL